MKRSILTIGLCLLLGYVYTQNPTAWIRINQLGYAPGATKTAVLAATSTLPIPTFELVDVATNRAVYSTATGRSFGAYGPFTGIAR